MSAVKLSLISVLTVPVTATKPVEQPVGVFVVLTPIGESVEKLSPMVRVLLL